MVQTNPWLALQTIKEQLRATESNLSDIVCVLTGVDDVAISGNSIVGASGAIYSIVHQVGGNFVVKARTLNDAATDYAQEVQTTFDDVDSMLTQEGGVLNFPSILLDIEQGCRMNKLFADVSAMFQSSHSLSLSDIDSLVNSSGLPADDAKKVFAYVKAAVHDGKVSTYGWLSVANACFNQGKNTTDQGTILMDRSKAFAIQSLAATLTTVLSTVITTVAAAVRNAFSALIFVIGQLISTVMTYVRKIANDTLLADLDANSFYVKGPVKYSESTFSGSQHLFRSPITAVHYGPYDLYMWMHNPQGPANPTNKFDVNGFISIGFDVCRAINDIVAHKITASYDSVTDKMTFAWSASNTTGSSLKTSYYANPYYYMSTSACLDILSDPSKLTTYIGLLIQFDRMLSFEFASGYSAGTAVVWNFTGTTDLLNSRFSMPGLGDSGSLIRAWCAVFGYLKAYGAEISLDNWGNNSSFLSMIQSWYNDFVTSHADRVPDKSQYGLYYYEHINATSHPSAGQNPGTCYEYVGDILHGFPTWGFSWTTELYTGVDSIPTDRAITVPDLNMDKVIAAFAIIASIISVAVVAKTVATKILAKRYTAKRLKDAKTLKDMKTYVQDHPSDEQAYKDYYKAIKKYNLKAKIFGYATYDPVNDWFNEPDGSTTAISAVSGAIPETLNSAIGTSTTVASMADTQLPAIGADVLNVSDNVSLTRADIQAVKDLIA